MWYLSFFWQAVIWHLLLGLTCQILCLKEKLLDINEYSKATIRKTNANCNLLLLKHKDSFGKSENLSKIFFAEILVFDHDYECKSSSSNVLLWISFIKKKKIIWIIFRIVRRASEQIYTRYQLPFGDQFWALSSICQCIAIHSKFPGKMSLYTVAT